LKRRIHHPWPLLEKEGSLKLEKALPPAKGEWLQ